jgi:hypothetical protein
LSLIYRGRHSRYVSVNNSLSILMVWLPRDCALRARNGQVSLLQRGACLFVQSSPLLVFVSPRKPPGPIRDSFPSTSRLRIIIQPPLLDVSHAFAVSLLRDYLLPLAFWSRFHPQFPIPRSPYPLSILYSVPVQKRALFVAPAIC